MQDLFFQVLNKLYCACVRTGTENLPSKTFNLLPFLLVTNTNKSNVRIQQQTAGRIRIQNKCTLNSEEWSWVFKICVRPTDWNVVLGIQIKQKSIIRVCEQKMDLACTEKLEKVSIAKHDRAIFCDNRVLNNLLRDENFSVPHCDYFEAVQNDIQPFMRKVVTTWMLEVKTFWLRTIDYSYSIFII